jgi:hypothetical protein
MSDEHVSPKGHSWSEVRERLLAPEERAASRLRVAAMIEVAKARAGKGISQKELETLRD